MNQINVNCVTYFDTGRWRGQWMACHRGETSAKLQTTVWDQQTTTPVVFKWPAREEPWILVVFHQDIVGFSSCDCATKTGIHLAQTWSFPHHNQVVFVPKPNQTLTTGHHDDFRTTGLRNNGFNMMGTMGCQTNGQFPKRWYFISISCLDFICF